MPKKPKGHKAGCKCPFCKRAKAKTPKAKNPTKKATRKANKSVSIAELKAGKRVVVRAAQLVKRGGRTMLKLFK